MQYIPFPRAGRPLGAALAAAALLAASLPLALAGCGESGSARTAAGAGSASSAPAQGSGSAPPAENAPAAPIAPVEKAASVEKTCCVPPGEAKAGLSRMPDPHASSVPDAGESGPTVIRKDAPPPGPAPEGMVWVPPGRFSMGSDYEPFGDARPIHTVELDGFWMDRHPVTNARFAKFVRATGYVTVAERRPDPKDYPGVPPEKLVPGAVVFSPPGEAVSLDNVGQWWAWVPGASWRHPEGPGSSIAGRENHPVVHVSWDDAAAYCAWAGRRLPTEAEWEYAARGGLAGKPFVWGDRLRPGGKIMANTFQGRFPNADTKEDGYGRTSPVGSFPPNGFGLYDMAGNVWQWCSDWYQPDYYARSPRRNPAGPDDSHDPQEPGIPKRIQRGGSFLCTDQYCNRYMPGGRGKGAVDTGTSHLGFRCVLSPGQTTAAR